MLDVRVVILSVMVSVTLEAIRFSTPFKILDSSVVNSILLFLFIPNFKLTFGISINRARTLIGLISVVVSNVVSTVVVASSVVVVVVTVVVSTLTLCEDA